MIEVPREGEEPAPRAGPPGALPQGPPAGPDAREERKWVAGVAPSPDVFDPVEGLWRFPVPMERWRPTSLALAQGLQHRLASLWGEDLGGDGLRVHALWMGGRSCRGVHVLTDLPAAVPEIPTLLPEVPPALYFERELQEMFGAVVRGAPDRRPLLLHLRHPSPPMRGGLAVAPLDQRLPYGFPVTEGEGIYEVPVGPVHAGVIEPGHFRFQVRGEEIVNLEVRLGYTHKGTERLFQGKEPGAAVVLAESVSGDMSVAGATVFVQAVEAALGRTPSWEAVRARGVLLEAERAAFLLGDVAGIALDVGYAAGAQRANLLRERAYQALEDLTGSRLGRGAVRLAPEVRPWPWGVAPGLSETYAGISRGTGVLREHLMDRPSVVDRIRGTGVLSPEVAGALGLVGPVARASGLDRDVRRDRPYGVYLDHEVRVAGRPGGDVEARLAVKVEEVQEACRLVVELLRSADPGVASPSREAEGAPPYRGLSLVESPRGELLVAVSMVPGASGRPRLRRVHVRDPSFLDWPAIEYAVRGNIVPDFPLCNKSLNLSYSGFDR